MAQPFTLIDLICEKQGGSMIIRQAFLHAVECGQQEWTANQLELIALGYVVKIYGEVL